MKGKKGFFGIVLLFGDIILFYAALFFALALRHRDFSFFPGSQTKVFVFYFSFIFLIWVFLLFLLDFYEIPLAKNIFHFFYNLLTFFLLAVGIGISYFYLQPQLSIAPKTILILDVLIFTLFLAVWRYFFLYILRIKHFQEKIIIVDFRPELAELLTKFLPRDTYELSAFFHTNPLLELKSISHLAKFGVISNLPRLKEIIQKEGVESIIFATDIHKNSIMAKEIFLGLPLKLNHISFNTFYENLTKKIPLEAVDEIWFLENISRVERKIDEALKRGFDIIFSFIGLLITVVLSPFLALSIKLDSPGPVFFTQKRVGKDRKVFTLYKFRTMKIALNQDKELWREKDPAQITGVGKILRKLYLDELPQSFNILKGDLSFVGPRPEWIELVKIFEKEIPFYALRYMVRPGFTGWAQLNFPASTSIEEAKEKFQYDLYYIKNRSFFLDLGIILKTMRIIFK